ncbi:TPA: hypothetical protein HA265_03390 [Candidatus Woesearchaeota archaeon]|nr:hypothetical protein [Candidatus Woesearchaeota archaeon]
MVRVDEILEDLGFEGREIRIYLALLRSGSSTALQISKETRIDRTTTYDILERLIDKGVVSSIVKNRTRHFSALSPKDLLVHYQQKFSSLQDILPELDRIARSQSEPVSCELFQGKEGLKTVLKDLIAAKKDYKAIGIRKEFEDILGFFNDQGVLKLDEFNVKEQAIVERGVEFRKVKKGLYRYLSKRLLSPVTTILYDDVTVFIIWAEPYFAIRVKNKTFSKSQNEYFRLLWQIAGS